MGFLSGLLDPGNVFNSREGGVSLTGMFDPAGAALNEAGAMPDFYDKINGNIDDWAGDVWDFEKSNFSDMWKKFKDDPTQLLIGAGDPFSAKVWSKATGKDYDPYVNQMGGATSDAYESAERKGIDTSNARGAHQVAQAIASFYGGGALGSMAGAAGQAAGIGAQAGQALGGAAVGGANSWANDGSFMEGAVQGGLGGLLGNMDYGGYAGMDPGIYRTTFNGALGGGLASSAAGGNFGEGALIGGLKSGGRGVYDMYTAGDMPDTGTIGGNMQDADGENSTTMGGQIMPVQMQANEQRQQALSANSGANVDSPAPTAAPSAVDQFMSAMNTGVQKVGGLDGLSTLAGQAMGLYDANRQRRRAKEQAQELSGLYGPNSPYAQQMRQRMERQDAAAGRRSQYGTRETELAAKMADTQARMAPTLNGLYNQESAARNRMMSNSLRLGTGLYKLYNQP